MSLHGIILIDLTGFGLILLILNLVRTHRLYVAYGVIWVLAVLSLMIVISVPALLALVTTAVGARFPASALSLLAFIFIFLMLIFITVQLSVLSSRQVDIIQTLAIRDLLARDEAAKLAKGQQQEQ